MTISSQDIISLTRARAKLTELCAQVQREHGEKILTKNGESCGESSILRSPVPLIGRMVKSKNSEVIL
jgi:hypothetical protein